MAEKREPMRTCIGCRVKQRKENLLRIVCTDDGVVPDRKGVKTGRGAYLCDNPVCLEKAIRTRALNRAFRRQISENSYRRLEEAFGRGDREENSR